MKHCLDWLIVFAVALAATGLPAQRSSANQERVAEGAKIFKNSCSVCHSLHPGQTKNGRSLSGVLRPHPAAKSEERVRRIITEGKVNMPAFKDRLSPDEISALITFLKQQ